MLAQRLFRHQMPGWCHRLRRGLQDRECQPGVPARWPVGGVEFAIALHAEKCLVVPNRENISKLRPDAENARAEAAQDRRLSEVISDLLVGIADQADENLFREEMRRAPVEMKIDTALVLRIRILEIVGEAADGGEFISRHGIEISVAAAEIDGAVTDADIGQTIRIVVADGNVTGAVDHEIVNAAVPFQFEGRIYISIRDEGIFQESCS